MRVSELELDIWGPEFFPGERIKKINLKKHVSCRYT